MTTVERFVEMFRRYSFGGLIASAIEDYLGLYVLSSASSVLQAHEFPSAAEKGKKEGHLLEFRNLESNMRMSAGTSFRL